MSRFRIPLMSIGLGAGVALLLNVGLAGGSAATPFSGSMWLATPNGLVGIQQTVTLRASTSVGEVATIEFSNAVTGTNKGQAVVDSHGFAYLPWTPNLPGSWGLTASVGGMTIGSTNITVETMPTVTALLAPGAVQAGQDITLTARVEALGGRITPSGLVSIRNNSNNIVAQGSVFPSIDAGVAVASLAWTPSRGETSLIAEYTPATSAFSRSTSRAQTPTVGTQPALTLRLPQVSYVGVADTYEVLIAPDRRSPEGGSAAFSVNMDGFTFYVMGGSKPVRDGVSATTWTPGVPGVQTIQVSYSTADSRFSGTAAQSINVQPAPQPDTVTSDHLGFAGNASFAAETTIDPKMTSKSGNPVIVSTNGPCVMNAGALSLLGAGICSVQARSLGNGGSLAGQSETFTLEILRADG